MYMFCSYSLLFFFFNDTATTEIYTLSLHDALPICAAAPPVPVPPSGRFSDMWVPPYRSRTDRKSTRLNSSHVRISYAVFCLKKKKKIHRSPSRDQVSTYATIG